MLCKSSHCLNCGKMLHYLNTGGYCIICLKEKQINERKKRSIDKREFNALELPVRRCLTFIYKYLDDPTQTQLRDICNSFNVEYEVIYEHLHLKEYVQNYAVCNPQLNKGPQVEVTIE